VALIRHLDRDQPKPVNGVSRRAMPVSSEVRQRNRPKREVRKEQWPWHRSGTH
jgi:hypothetical protein